MEENLQMLKPRAQFKQLIQLNNYKHNKKTQITQLKNGQKTYIDISPEKKYKWLIGM